MKNNKLIFLFADTIRSRAYLQNIVKYNLFKNKIILINNNKKKYFGVKKKVNNEKIRSELGKKYFFDPNLTLLETIKKFNLKYQYLGTDDINSKEAFNNIKKLAYKYIVYSGYGGIILKKHLFKINKKFIHVHGGILPEYKGSTTNYYSILEKNIYGATSLYLNSKIDSGEIIKRKIYKIESPLEEMDYYYDNLLRSETLVETLKFIQLNKKYQMKKINNKKGQTYYIIHPILKKLSILKINENQL